jgi:hypothetical protein
VQRLITPCYLHGGDLLGYPAVTKSDPNVAVSAVTLQLAVASRPQPVNGKLAFTGSLCCHELASGRFPGHSWKLLFVSKIRTFIDSDCQKE